MEGEWVVVVEVVVVVVEIPFVAKSAERRR